MVQTSVWAVGDQEKVDMETDTICDFQDDDHVGNHKKWKKVTKSGQRVHMRTYFVFGWPQHDDVTEITWQRDHGTNDLNAKSAKNIVSFVHKFKDDTWLKRFVHFISRLPR